MSEIPAETGKNSGTKEKSKRKPETFILPYKDYQASAIKQNSGKESQFIHQLCNQWAESSQVVITNTVMESSVCHEHGG